MLVGKLQDRGRMLTIPSFSVSRLRCVCIHPTELKIKFNIVGCSSGLVAEVPRPSLLFYR